MASIFYPTCWIWRPSDFLKTLHLSPKISDSIWRQTLTILVFHFTWHGKSSMRYGCLIPGRVQACQTELTQGREWVRVMASQRRGQPRSKPEWVMGFLEMDGQLFYSRKDHHPLCSQAYAKQEFVFQ